MREILFRGKTEKGEWIEGFYHYSNLINPTTKELVKTTHWILPICGQDAYDVIPESVSEFTGLTDKNGKKIFEGDILSVAQIMDGIGKYNFPPLKYPVNVVVIWDKCAWSWKTICKDKRYIHFPDAWCHFECEVIGDIHDNPELIKERF